MSEGYHLGNIGSNAGRPPLTAEQIKKNNEIDLALQEAEKKRKEIRNRLLSKGEKMTEVTANAMQEELERIKKPN